ncbi:MAG: hypothetical protein QM572_17760 [Nocardioides sp.]|uniref:hypothetical protein n=1 Tax=Nocardioides sp. TaxID=35761 RepID=UPI0039E4A0FF
MTSPTPPSTLPPVATPSATPAAPADRPTTPADQPATQETPRAKRPPRLIRLWKAIAVAVACLVVGLGAGGVIGSQLGGDSAPSGVPTMGQGGPGGQDGQGGPGGQQGGTGTDSGSAGGTDSGTSDSGTTDSGTAS